MNICIKCGFPVRDKRDMCPVCDGSSPYPDAILPDGTPLYLKTSKYPEYASLQLELYDMLMNYKRNLEDN